jgi:hypothetical protein
LFINSKKKDVFGKAKTSQSVVLSSQNCLFHNSTKNKNLTQDVNIKGMKIVEKSLKVTSLGCSCEVFLSFWVNPAFLVFSRGLWWKRYLQKHVPGAPKRPPASATPAGIVPPPPPNLLLNLASLAMGTFSFYLR